jgi:hypothetical protein
MDVSRKSTIGRPFKQLGGLFIQYIRQITPAVTKKKLQTGAAYQKVAGEQDVKKEEGTKEPLRFKRTETERNVFINTKEEDTGFKRGGWEDSRIMFDIPPLTQVGDGIALINPFEEMDSSVWEAKIAAAKEMDIFEDLGEVNPFA